MERFHLQRRLRVTLSLTSYSGFSSYHINMSTFIIVINMFSFLLFKDTSNNLPEL